MTPKEKAQELIDKFLYTVEDITQTFILSQFSAKQCALILCDEILSLGYSRPYYDEVKHELSLL